MHVCRIGHWKRNFSTLRTHNQYHITALISNQFTSPLQPAARQHFIRSTPFETTAFEPGHLIFYMQTHLPFHLSSIKWTNDVHIREAIGDMSVYALKCRAWTARTHLTVHPCGLQAFKRGSMPLKTLCFPEHESLRVTVNWNQVQFPEICMDAIVCLIELQLQHQRKWSGSVSFLNDCLRLG